MNVTNAQDCAQLCFAMDCHQAVFVPASETAIAPSCLLLNVAEADECADIDDSERVTDVDGESPVRLFCMTCDRK